jgi:hypothetical protein
VSVSEEGGEQRDFLPLSRIETWPFILQARSVYQL